jgi:two-component system nitrogen regulation response regulator GlnG
MGQPGRLRPSQEIHADPQVLTVLVVDDEQASLRNYAAMLERAGYGVVAFDSAASALSALREGTRPDAVVTDYRMPGMNGLEFLEVLRRERPSVPVIMLTAHSDIDIYFKSFSLGLFDFINKPFHEAELIRIVRTALGGPGRARRSRGNRS